jgi:hypothetical protein
LEKFEEGWTGPSEDVACRIAGDEWNEDRVEYLDLGKE